MPQFSELFRFTHTEIRTLLMRAKKRKWVDGLSLATVPATTEYGRLLVITPRTTGNAPERNRIRRRLKSIFYEEKLFTQKQDVVVRVSRPALSIPFEQLKQILVSCVLHG